MHACCPPASPSTLLQDRDRAEAVQLYEQLRAATDADDVPEPDVVALGDDDKHQQEAAQ